MCQYCGKTPPDVSLEIDHIKPVSKNGTNDINNLITACFDCNRGKKHIELDVIPETINLKSQVLKEKEEQLKEYRKLIKKIDAREKRDCKKINEVYNECFPNYELTERFLTTTVKQFIRKLPLSEVIDAMYLAAEKIQHKDNSIRYFCGICWNKIRDIDGK